MGRFKTSQQQPESLEDRFARYKDMFEWSKEYQLELKDQFNSDCRQALRHNKNPVKENLATMPFLDTCVDRPSTGRESGVFYAVDFGGTNLRVVRVSLDGHGHAKSEHSTANIEELGKSLNLPRGLMDAKATATQLFDALATAVSKFMQQNGDYEVGKKDGQIFPVGFTFSFPMVQNSLCSGTCTCWGKGFETGRDTEDKVEGEADICQLLDAAFVRKDVPAQVVAALNDTTGTLLSTGYTSHADPHAPPCVVGLILGTGMNACYYDRAAKEYGYQGVLINTECGSYSRGLRRNIIDMQVDLADYQPGRQLTEKMCSGLYIPEMCRRAILRVFQFRAAPRTWVRRTLSTAACCAAAYDESPDLDAVRDLLKIQLEWDVKEKRHLEMVRDLCRAVLKRSATMLSVIIAALSKQTGKLQFAAGGVTVGIDGSVYVQNEQFRKDTREALRDLLGEGLAKLIRLEISLDGSGLGAAILAACEANKGVLSAKHSLF